MISAFFAKINAGIAAIGMAVGGLLGLNPEPQIVYVPVEQPAAEEESLGADTVLPIAGAVYYLAGTGISSSATSFTLTSFTIPQNGKKIVDSELSDTFYVTFEPGNRSRQEISSCTTVVQNADDTATISGCTRGLSPVTPYTASTSLQFAHGGGSTLVFSNPPQLYNDAAMKGNDETITGQWTFNVFPVTASTSIASATTSGWVELATGAEAASSTIEGDIAGSKLALHTTISTSSAPSSGNVVVVTGDDGNIDLGFLPSIVGSSTVRIFTATSTWTKPTDLKHIVVEILGGGGSGGSQTSASGQFGGGGGAGGYCREILSANALAATTSVYIGVGTGGTAVSGDSNGNSGQPSSFSTFASSTGGVGGNTSGVGALGGIGKNCDLNITGGAGNAGHYVTADDGIGGKGGDSFYGGGGIGSMNDLGSAGTGYGSGGAGSADTTSGLPSSGAGATGVVIITEYF